jgi:hypothetical protein
MAQAVLTMPVADGPIDKHCRGRADFVRCAPPAPFAESRRP